MSPILQSADVVAHHSPCVLIHPSSPSFGPEASHSAECWRSRSSLSLRSHSPILPFIWARGCCWVRSCSNC